MLCLTVSLLALMGLEFYGNFPLSLPPWEFVSFSFISGEPSSLISTMDGRPLQCPEFFENHSRSRIENTEEESGYRGGFL